MIIDVVIYVCPLIVHTYGSSELNNSSWNNDFKYIIIILFSIFYYAQNFWSIVKKYFLII